MKKFVLEKINNYIPYLENNYPIFLENSERLVEFNFNFEDIVTKFIEHCEFHASKKKEIPLLVDSINDRFTDSKILESNVNNAVTNNAISNNLHSNNVPSNSNSQNINNNNPNSQNLNNNSQNLNNNNNNNNISASLNINNNYANISQNLLANPEKPSNVTLEEHEVAAKTGTINSLTKEEPIKNEQQLNEEIDINGIPLRKDFSEESDGNNSLNTSDKIFLETVYYSKKKTELSQIDSNVIDGMMLCDSDLEVFLCALEKNEYFEGKVLITEQLLSDETSIKISTILKKNIPKITVLDLSKNLKMSKLTGVYIGEALKQNNTLKSVFFTNNSLTTEGANRLIESIRYNKFIRDIDFGNLTDSSLKVLTHFLSNEHYLANISFGEDISETWKEETKNDFVVALRKNQYNRKLLSINIYCEDVWTHYNLLGNVSLLTQKNREGFLKEQNNIYKMRALEYNHPEYFEEDNHLENKYKFSCKNYISNVFSTVLDEGLYYLEKERMNMLRDAEIANVKCEKDNKDKFLEDICTSDGSILFLCQFLLTKIDK